MFEVDNFGKRDVEMNTTGKLKFKKLDPNAILPTRAYNDDVGYDVVALEDPVFDKKNTFVEYRTGLAVETPIGYHLELVPRSSISKYDLVLANSLGIIDFSFRGELRFRFKYVPRFENNFLQQLPFLYKKGDKIGQIVIRKTESLEIEEVNELSSTIRDTGGFGSTDKK